MSKVYTFVRTLL